MIFSWISINYISICSKFNRIRESKITVKRIAHHIFNTSKVKIQQINEEKESSPEEKRILRKFRNQNWQAMMIKVYNKGEGMSKRNAISPTPRTVYFRIHKDAFNHTEDGINPNIKLKILEMQIKKTPMVEGNQKCYLIESTWVVLLLRFKAYETKTIKLKIFDQ